MYLCTCSGALIIHVELVLFYMYYLQILKLQAQMDVNTVLGLAGAIAARASYDARRTLTAAANTARPNMLLTSKSSATTNTNSSSVSNSDITVTAAEAGATLIDLQLGMTLLQLGINPFEDGSSAPQLLRSFKNFDNEVSHSF
jgi:hypothetical protein